MAHLTWSDYLTVYDHHGHTDSMPTKFTMEEHLDKAEIDRHGVLLNLQGILDAAASYNHKGGISPLKEKITFLEEGGYHHIFSVEVEGDETLIARVSRADVPDSSESWLDKKTNGELALLRYLKDNSSVPVPAVFCLSSISAISHGITVKLPFLLMERVKGTELAGAYASLSLTQKIELTRKVAKEMGDIFNVTSSVSGSAIGAKADGSLTFGPSIESARGAYPPFSVKPYSPNDLAVLCIEHLRKTCPADASPALDALDNVRHQVCSTAVPSTFHLHHLALKMPNVFIESGPDGNIQMSKIIDWDRHTFLPAPLAADYPIWLMLDGYYNPKYNPRGGKVVIWWEDEHGIIQKLRNVFKESVRESHGEFYDHLCNGTAQRELFYWFDCWDDNKSNYDAILAWSKSFISPDRVE